MNSEIKVVEKSKKLINSFKYAIQGILSSFKTERNMKIHIFIMILVISAGIILKINKYELYSKGEFVYDSMMIEKKHHIVRDNMLRVIDINLDFLSNIDYNKIKKGNEYNLEKLLYFFVCNDKKLLDNIYNGNGLMRNISKIFNILLPITLPSTISPLPDRRDFTLTANSGALVPNATIVRPINIFDTLKLEATLLAPSTKKSAPLINIMNPTINRIIFIANIYPPFFFSYE